MRMEDYGINPKTMRHTQILTSMESVFLSLLWGEHVGKTNKIPAVMLAILYAEKVSGYDIRRDPRYMGIWKRHVRRMQNHLLMDHDHVPILSKAGLDGGYWLAETDAEAAAFYHSFRKRGMTGLVKASRGKKAAMVEIMTQLSFQFEDLVDKTGNLRETSVSSNVPVDVVDAFLGKMLERPEEYSEGLRKIAKKYGGILLPRNQVEEMRKQAAILQAMTEKLVAA